MVDVLQSGSSDPLEHPARLTALRSLDGDPAGDPVFDRLTRLAARLADAPAATLTLIHTDRRVLASAHGLPPALAELREVPHSHCVCVRVRQTRAPLIVADAARDPHLAMHPAVTEWGMRAYLGVPVTCVEGQVLGVLAVVASEPREWAPDVVHALEDLARLGGAEFGRRRQLAVLAHRERELCASERFSDVLLESSPDCVKLLDVDGRLTFMNGPGRCLMEVDDFAAVDGADWAAVWAGEGAAHARAAVRTALEGGTGRFTGRCATLKGTPKWWDVTVTPVRDHRGAIVRLLSVSRDISEAERNAEQLKGSEARLRLAIDLAGMVVWERALETDRLHDRALPGDGRLAHIRADAFATYDGFLAAVHPDDRERVRRTHAEAVASGGEFSIEFRITGPDGTLRWNHSRGRVLHDARGRPERIVGVSLDLTQRVTLEAQLRQAQKMEAVGQLAAGVAHDFNNLLTIIIASTLFAREALPSDSAVHAELDAVDGAAAHAAQLTRQLLAFSRRQLLKPEPLDANRVVRGLEPLLRRVIGEDVAVLTRLAPMLPAVLADPGQLEQVLINLAVNARDAMPDGGRLSIETAHVVLTEADVARREAAVPPGSYVRLRVRDTGTGMDEATRARVFEPFFTTKAAGCGTGLGLATVYGIVKQSGGYVWVSSVPGRGSTFEIDLPVTGGAEAGAPLADPGAPAALPAGAGTVLVVEDERPVREVVRRVLTRYGYSVLEAADGREALALVDRHPDTIDLVVTDMVMPEMSGHALAQALGARRPALPLLFMSGYTDDDIARRGLERPNVAFLPKPFSAEALLAAVRAAAAGMG